MPSSHIIPPIVWPGKGKRSVWTDLSYGRRLSSYPVFGACSYQLHHRVIWPVGGAQDYQGLAKGSNQIMATAKQVSDVKQIQPITNKTNVKIIS